MSALALAVLVGAIAALVVGTQELPRRGQARVEGGYSTSAVGAPAYAAVFTASGDFSGWLWIEIGTALAVVAGLALLITTARGRSVSAAEDRGTRSPLGLLRISALLTLALGLIAVFIGLAVITHHLHQIVDTVIPHHGTKRPSIDIDVPGRALVGWAAGVAATAGLGVAVAGRRGHGIEPGVQIA